MKISTKGRYALRMLLDLAQNQGEGYVTLKDIAARQEISKKYLEQIVPLMNGHELLVTNRGHQGGYRLARRPEETPVGEILRAVEGSLKPVACMENTPNRCARCTFCMTLPVWTELDRIMESYLDAITLQNVLDGDVSARHTGMTEQALC